MSQSNKRPYHHGDLKRAIVETAQDMLGEDKGWQFTLREVARRAGVSHTAPYKHFPDKAALLAELATSGFRKLRRVVAAATTRRSRSSRDEFIAAAKAYIQFGISNPSLYRLMFSADVERSAFPELHEAGLSAFAELVGILERGQQIGSFKAQPVQGQAAACWSLVHGFTLLSIEQQLLPEKVGTHPIDGVLATLLAGIEA